ncbi:predicted protein [Candida tropicalis MYA-3404]|uniref:Uncharacterized protein n=1 Tax=Candida tropicalis (strain ATCC MYA-3404 / T1) TaxID=294747 RepID=C5M3R6_CANTT|nr:predicted protein [Candida tropicalis MYA-3404]EER35966.1 predicted protein [Candida tropicalis MYA-3404]
MATTTNNILSSDLRPYSLLQAYISDEDSEVPNEEVENEPEEECSDLEDSTTIDMATTNTTATSDSVTSVNTINLIQTLHEYELSQSESLTFLYNLLFDDDSNLSKADILKILNSLKLREDNLPFTISNDTSSDIQGIKWPRKLHEKFCKDRLRVGQDNWFHNMQNSREDAMEVCEF